MGQHEVNIGPQITKRGTEHVAGQQILSGGGTRHDTTPAGPPARVAELMDAADTSEAEFASEMSNDPDSKVVDWWDALASPEKTQCWEGWKKARAVVIAVEALL